MGNDHAIGQNVANCEKCPIPKATCAWYQRLLHCGKLCPISVAIVRQIGRT